MRFGSQDFWGASPGWRPTYLNLCHRESQHSLYVFSLDYFTLSSESHPQKNKTFICHWNPGWGVNVWSSTQIAEAREAFLLKRLGFFAHVPKRWKTAERRIFLFQFSNHIVVSCFLSLVILHTCHVWIFLGAEALNKKPCFKECNK